MDIEVLGFLGFVFASTATANMACEYRKDVLRRRYCEQKTTQPDNFGRLRSSITFGGRSATLSALSRFSLLRWISR
jgi:hypothetical protein